MKKNIWSIIIFLGFVCFFEISSGQGAKVKFDTEVPKRITLPAFNRCVDKATRLLQTNKLSAIFDKDHISIMRCLNTILTFNLADSSNRFIDPRYRKLQLVADKKEYALNIAKIYPGWTFNRGLGCYFPKLQMELYGTPRLYATYAVINVK